ncbi:MAG TPA: NAD(P)H-dependent oxidoreductase [Burkholderiaceae bacterium]
MAQQGEKPVGGAKPGLLIVWWSMTGCSRQLAGAAARGASSECGNALVVRSLPANRAGPQDVLAAAAFLFVTPENLGTMAGMLKDFFDRSYYAALDRVVARPYASIVCAGTDGEGATRQIDRIATGWRLRRVAEPLIVCSQAQTPQQILAPKVVPPEALDSAFSVGATLASGLALGIW